MLTPFVFGAKTSQSFHLTDSNCGRQCVTMVQCDTSSSIIHNQTHLHGFHSVRHIHIAHTHMQLPIESPLRGCNELLKAPERQARLACCAVTATMEGFGLSPANAGRGWGRVGGGWNGLP